MTSLARVRQVLQEDLTRSGVERTHLKRIDLGPVGPEGDVAVWIVDGPEIRKRLDPDFNCCGQHYHFKFIPEDEFWIDQHSNPVEHAFFIKRLEIERDEMRKGRTYEQAKEVAGEVEKKERLRVRVREGLSMAQSPRRTLFGMTRDWTPVWLVDGRFVRDLLDVHFRSGAHGYVRTYIPDDEVWLDDTIGKTWVELEVLFVLLHELYERRMMYRGDDYETAHRKANRLEQDCRNRPERLRSALRKLGWIPD